MTGSRTALILTGGGARPGYLLFARRDALASMDPGLADTSAPRSENTDFLDFS